MVLLFAPSGYSVVFTCNLPPVTASTPQICLVEFHVAMVEYLLSWILQPSDIRKRFIDAVWICTTQQLTKLSPQANIAIRVSHSLFAPYWLKFYSNLYYSGENAFTYSATHQRPFYVYEDCIWWLFKVRFVFTTKSTRNSFVLYPQIVVGEIFTSYLT